MKKLVGGIVILMAIVMFTSSCEKVIEVDVKDAQSLLVIEGTVTNHIDTQLVKVSRSVLLGDRNTFAGISGATVTITDELGSVFTLRERQPGIYSSRRLRGIPGRKYTLKVLAEGKEYTATSAMPAQVPIDSTGLSMTTFFEEEIKAVQILFQDPPGRKNYYRFLLRVNGTRSRSIFAFNDDFNDGKSVVRELLDFDLDLETGDIAEIEMQCIDQNIYRYFQGLDQNENRGGASTTPSNPVSNLKGGALGYFSAHTVQQERIQIP